MSNLYSGKDFKMARVRFDIKAINLAKVLKISTSKLSLIENNHIKCPTDIYEKLVKILNM